MNALQQRLATHLARRPRLEPHVYVARTAVVVGDVHLGEASSVWHHAVLRGDLQAIRIGHHTNLQDRVVVHLAADQGCEVGHYVTVGHGAILHACRIGDLSLIGMGAIVLDGAEVEPQCLIGAGAVVTPGKRIPAGSLALGSPARVVRELTAEEKAHLRASAEHYVEIAAYCLKHGIEVGTPTDG